MATFFDGLVAGIGVLLTGVGSVVGIRTAQEPRHEVLVKDGVHEIRRYAPYIVATTSSAGDRDASANDSFRLLAGYIFGNNRARESIEMTAPVVMKAEGTSIEMTAPVVMAPDGERWTMAFVLPERFTLENVPMPVDPRIEIREVPAEDLAVVRFSGIADQQAILAQERKLRAWLGQAQGHAYEALGGYRYAGYDPPFTLPFLRRNEVMIPVKPAAAGSSR